MKQYKHLNDSQVQYILANYKKMTVQEMAAHLKIEAYKVSLFCQAEYLIPKSKRGTRRPKDTWHNEKGFKKSYGVNQPAPQKIKRVNDGYSNRSQKQVIDHYLNMK